MGQPLGDIFRRWTAYRCTGFEGSNRIKDRFPIVQELRTKFLDQIGGKLIQRNPSFGRLSRKLAYKIMSSSEGNAPTNQLIGKIGGQQDRVTGCFGGYIPVND